MPTPPSRLSLFVPLALTSAAVIATVCPATTADAANPDDYASGSVIEGAFEIRIADFDDGTARISYHLRTDTGVVQVDLDPLAYPQLERGAILRVYGTRLDRHHFDADWIELVAPPPAPLIDPTPRPPRRIATIMVHTGTPDDRTVEDMRERVFLSDTSTHRFYRENSYGIESFVGDVFGWYQIDDPGGCGEDEIADAARAAMAADGHNLDDYEQFMYYMTRRDCGWSGLASIGSPDDAAQDTWYNGSAGCVVLAQELGHNYGMIHSHSYSCDGGPYPGPESCSSNEYGHGYDPLGGGCGHINDYQKAYMGWVQECNVLTAPTSGTYNLLPLELPCNGTQALQLPTGGGEGDGFYYLEYRRPIGQFDDEAGVLVHIGDQYEGGGGWGGPEGWLLDFDDADNRGWFMHAGQSHDDYDGRVSFAVLEETETHAVIEVTYPGGGSGSPTCQGGGAPADGGNGHIGSLECAPGPTGDDPVPPTVSITAPPDGMEYAAPASFAVTAEAMDDRMIAQVDLRLDGTSVGIDQTAPYEWSVADLQAGTYVLTAVASDGSNQATSDPVTVTVTGGEDTGASEDAGSGSEGGTDGGDGGSSDGEGGTEGGSGDDADGGTADDGGGDDLPPPPPPTTSSTTANPFDDESGTGCGCSTGSRGAPLGWLALIMFAPLRSRRRSA